MKAGDRIYYYNGKDLIECIFEAWSTQGYFDLIPGGTNEWYIRTEPCVILRSYDGEFFRTDIENVYTDKALAKRKLKL